MLVESVCRNQTVRVCSRFRHFYDGIVQPDGGACMIRKLSLACAGAIVVGAAALRGCSGNNVPDGQPSFYQDLAGPTASLDPELMRLANEQATAMVARGTLDHNLSTPFQERIRKSKFDASVAVENIGAGYHTLAEAFSGWRDSPPHRANMLNANV